MDNSNIDVSNGDPPRITIEDIINHPRLPDARKAYLDHFLQVYGGDPFLVRLLIESGRFLIYLIAVILEAGEDPARRDTWLTVGLLKKTMAMFGLTSGRHVDELIARLCAVGYMESRVAERDLRVRILSPTEKMRAHDRAWIAAHYTPLIVLYPQHDYQRVMRWEPEFHAVYRRTSVAYLPMIAGLYATIPDMGFFLNRAAGYMVIAALLQAALTEGDHPHAAVPYADIGDRFGVSRTHVRKLLVAAEAAGLVRLQGRGGHQVEILPRLLASHDQGIATGMYIHDIVYRAAIRASAHT